MDELEERGLHPCSRSRLSNVWAVGAWLCSRSLYVYVDAPEPCTIYREIVDIRDQRYL